MVNCNRVRVGLTAVQCCTVGLHSIIKTVYPAVQISKTHLSSVVFSILASAGLVFNSANSRYKAELNMTTVNSVLVADRQRNLQRDILNSHTLTNTKIWLNYNANQNLKYKRS